MRSTWKPEPGSCCAMMSRKASPSARTTRIAPAACRVPEVRVAAPVPRSGTPVAGSVTGRSSDSCTSVEVDRRVAQGRPPSPQPDRTTNDPDSRWDSPWIPTAIGLGFVVVALIVYGASHPVRYYNHFVWQALAFLDGRVAIDFPVPASAGGPGNESFQDVLAILNPDGSMS